jgi:hypothetical protein
VNAPRARWLLVALAVVVGAIGGAIWDWYNWHPMSAVVATLVAIPLVLLGVLLLVIRARRSRQVGQVVLALGLGIVAGQILGPSRPDLDGSSGSLTVALSSPVVATATAPASCSFDSEGQFQVSGDPNMRFQLAPEDPSIPADIDERDFVSFHLTVGDRWRDGSSPRSDDRQLSVHVDYVVEQPRVVMVADDTATLVIEGTPQAGTATFAALVRSMTEDEATGGPIDLAGTMTWTC